MKGLFILVAIIGLLLLIVSFFVESPTSGPSVLLKIAGGCAMLGLFGFIVVRFLEQGKGEEE